MAARKVLIPLLVVLAIASAYFENLTGIGQDERAFAAQGDSTLRAAGYAFAIWGLLFAGMIAYALFQTRKGAGTPAATMAWPASIAFIAIGGWSIISALDYPWLTIPFILLGPIALVTGLSKAGRLTTTATKGERWFVVWPLAALAGWLTAASALNILIVLTRFDLLAGIDDAAALAGIAVITVLAVWIARRIRTFAYPALIAWGLVGVAVAEMERQPMLAWAAVGGAAIAVVGGFIASRRRGG